MRKNNVSVFLAWRSTSVAAVLKQTLAEDETRAIKKRLALHTTIAYKGVSTQ
jgi:hypothetical protein